MDVVFLLFVLPTVLGYESGAPISVCLTLAPRHRGNSPQDTEPPYTITSTQRVVAQGSTVTFSVGSPGGTPFQGFMLQARDPGTPDKPFLGKFTLVSSDAKTIDCGLGNSNTVTHRDKSTKTKMDFTFQLPPDYVGNIVFQGTVLQDFSHFWTDIKSDTFEVVKGSQADVAVQSDVLPITTNIDPMTEGCDSIKSCFGVPQGCIPSATCTAVVTFQVQATLAVFEMRAQDSVYVAVGLSDDNQMGNDSVVECVHLPTGSKPNLFTSWNVAGDKDNKRFPGKPQDQGVSLLESSFVEGEVACKFQRAVSTTVNGVVFNLTRDPLFILLASGSALRGDKITYHDRTKAATSQAQLLSTVGVVAVQTETKVLQRLHAAAMLAAWIGAATPALLLARYYKQTWVGRQLCGKAHWFAWHQALMATTWLLTIIGFVVIFSEVQGWTEVDNPHAVLGTITTGLAFVQPFMALLRPPPDSPKRPIFNWAHFLVGNAAHLLAVVTIFFATKLEDANLPFFFIWLLVAYVVFYVLVHTTLTLAALSSANTAKEHADNNVQMSDMRSSGPDAQTPSDTPHSRLRKIILIISLVIIVSLTTVLVVVAILSHE